MRVGMEPMKGRAGVERRKRPWGGIALARFVAAALTAGCAVSAPVYYPTAGANTAARESNCPFLVFGASPGAGWSEIGRVAVEGSVAGSPYRILPQFVGEVRPLVCGAGGDALLVEFDPSGWIMGGVVLRKTATPPMASSM